MTTTTVTQAAVRAADPPAGLAARIALYRQVYALAVAGRGWPPDPWPLPPGVGK